MTATHTVPRRGQKSRSVSQSPAARARPSMRYDERARPARPAAGRASPSSPRWPMPPGVPGLAYAVARLRGAVRPPVTVTTPPADIRFERDVPVVVRDGTILRVNVFRPAADGAYPVLMSAPPYGKDHLPRRTPVGYLPPVMLRLMRQDRPFRFSAWTSWEAPDPAYWVPRGYVVMNCDL